MYRTVQKFDGGNIDEFDEFFAICQKFYHSKFSFPIAVACKADAIRQNFTCQFFPNPQFVKNFHRQNLRHTVVCVCVCVCVHACVCVCARVRETEK